MVLCSPPIYICNSYHKKQYISATHTCGKVSMGNGQRYQHATSLLYLSVAAAAPAADLLLSRRQPCQSGGEEQESAGARAQYKENKQKERSSFLLFFSCHSPCLARGGISCCCYCWFFFSPHRAMNPHFLSCYCFSCSCWSLCYLGVGVCEERRVGGIAFDAHCYYF